MSDLWKEYPDLMSAYEKIPRKTDLRQEFEAGWGKALSLATDAKDKAAAKAAVPAKEIETLLRALTEPFTREPGEAGAEPQGLKNLPAAFARRAGGFCRGCGSKLNPATVFCKGCGAKIK